MRERVFRSLAGALAVLGLAVGVGLTVGPVRVKADPNGICIYEPAGVTTPIAGIPVLPECDVNRTLKTTAGGGGGTGAPLPGGTSSNATSNQSVGIQAYDGSGHLVPLQETGGALNVAGAGGGGGAPLPTNTTTPIAANQGVGIEAVLGANVVPLSANGSSLNTYINGGSIGNTAFGITGSLPAGANTIGVVGIGSGIGSSAGNPLYITGGSGGGASGTAGSAGSTAQYVQGIAGGVAIPVSGAFYQATQPVSGTVGLGTGIGSTSGNPLYVSGAGGGSGAPLSTATTTPIAASQGVGMEANVGGNMTALTATGNSLNTNITGGSIANTAFGITGAIPAGANSIGTVVLSGTFPTGYTPGSGSTGALGALGDLINDEIAVNTTLGTTNSTLSTISTNIAKNQYTSGALNVDVVAGGGGSGGGASGANGTAGTTAQYVQGAGPLGVPVAVSLPYSMSSDNQANQSYSAVGLVGYDSSGNNLDRIQEDGNGDLDVNIKGSSPVSLATGSNTIGSVAISGAGTTSGNPLYTACTSGCTGTGSVATGSSTFTTQLTGTGSSPICPNSSGVPTVTVKCTIVAISVGCAYNAASTCSGALPAANLGAIYDTNSTSGASQATQIFSYGALGGSTGFQTIFPWGPGGYTVQNGSLIANSGSFGTNVVLFISGHF